MRFFFFPFFFHLLFPFHPFSLRPRELTRELSYIFFFRKLFWSLLFNDPISLKSLPYFNYIKGELEGELESFDEPWGFYLRSRLDCARECNRNSSRLDNNFDPSTMMFKNSCYVFHTVSFDPRRNGAPRNSSKRTFKLHTPLWTRFLYSYMGRNVSVSPSPSSCFLANSSLSSLSKLIFREGQFCYAPPINEPLYLIFDYGNSI